MEITVERKWKRDGYTIGTLSIDGKRFGDGKHYCCTLEDTDRGLDSKMPISKILFMKRPHITAIPTGRYEVTLTYSPHFHRTLPLLNNVPGYSGVRIHPGNTAADTDGCILVGENTAKGRVNKSQYWFTLVMWEITRTIDKGGKVFITIK